MTWSNLIPQQLPSAGERTPLSHNEQRPDVRRAPDRPAPEMRIGAILPYFGGKRTAAPQIVPEFGEHSAYFGFCCGSLAVEFAKEPCPMETVFDLHGDLINLARVLSSDHWLDLYNRCGRTLMGDGLFDEAKAICLFDGQVAPSVEEVREEHVERAYWFLVMSWQGRNGSAGTKLHNVTCATRYTSNGGSGGYRWHSAVESMPAWHERLRRMLVKQVDVFEAIERIEDRSGTVIYWDAPYLRKGTKYLHDYVVECKVAEALADGGGAAPGKRNDHVRQALALRRFKRTRVVVSYYDEPELDLLYPAALGWTKRHIRVTKALTNAGQRGGKVVDAPEVLLINGPSKVDRGGRLF